MYIAFHIYIIFVVSFTLVNYICKTKKAIHCTLRLDIKTLSSPWSHCDYRFPILANSYKILNNLHCKF